MDFGQARRLENVREINRSGEATGRVHILIKERAHSCCLRLEEDSRRVENGQPWPRRGDHRRRRDYRRRLDKRRFDEQSLDG